VTVADGKLRRVEAFGSWAEADAAVQLGGDEAARERRPPGRDRGFPFLLRRPAAQPALG